MGNRYGRFVKTALITDIRNSIECEIVFPYEVINKIDSLKGDSMTKAVTGLASKVGNFFKGKSTESIPPERPFDCFEAIISSITRDQEGKLYKVLLEKGNGRLMQFLQFGPEVYWRYCDGFLGWKTGQLNSECLQSDSTFREDRRLMKSGNLEAAQKCE